MKKRFKTIALLGSVGDTKTNLEWHWRLGVIARLTNQGFRENLFFNPVTDNWDKAFQAKEDAIKTARQTLWFVHITDTHQPENPVSIYSIHEVDRQLYRCRAENRFVLSVDTTSMASHLQKGIAKIIQDLRADFPRAPIFGPSSIALVEAEQWLAQNIRKR